MSSVKDIINDRVRESLIIMKKELFSYFASPIAYIVIIVFLIFTGLLFFQNYFIRGLADMRGFFQLLPWLFSILVPAVTMKLFAEEKHTGSIEMLLTLPVTTMDVVIGKLLAATLFCIIMLIPTSLYVVTVAMSGTIDIGPVIGGYAGSILLAACYASVGLFASSITRNQIISLLVALIICFLFTAIDQIIFFIPGFVAGLLEYAGTAFHFKNISKGVIDTRDLIYFASFISVFVLITVKYVDERK